jgi:Ca2+-binding RTX toxin-like protein
MTPGITVVDARSRGKEKKMKRGIIMLAAMLAALVLGSGVALAATIVGTNNADTRTGTANRDLMYGLGGNDILRGLDGNDEIHGDAGSDQNLNGGPGNDEVSGGSGGDVIAGGASTTSGQNELYGGSGADTIVADVPGAYDEVYGGSGNDLIFVADGLYDYVDCGHYASPNSSASDSDTIYADAGDEVVECENTNP